MNPTMWYVIGIGTVHHSHFLKFEANIPELVMRPMTLYFGMPLTQLIKQDVANSNLASQSLTSLMGRFRYIYMKTDPSAFVTNNGAQLRDKLEFMSLAQDNFGVCPLRLDDDVMHLTTTLAGMDANVELFYLLVSAKTNIPFTELMGKSAQGMDATGTGDRRKWYDTCRTIQSDTKDNILVAYGIVAGTITGHYVKFPDYVFNPLEESSEKERAENIRSYAEVARALIELGGKQSDVFEWLKSFKEFHLDNIALEELASDLDDYPDDGPNGGGMLPDIFGTRTSNADWKESDHPRDKDGKFGAGGGSKSSENPKADVKKDTKDVFGESFSEYSGRPDEAIQKLLWEKRGHVPAAITKDGVGDIDLVWGEDGPKGYGLAHIIERRDAEGKDGIEFVKSIPEIIKTGTVDFRHQKLGRLYVTSQDKNVVIRLDWNGTERNWLATAFEIYN